MRREETGGEVRKGEGEEEGREDVLRKLKTNQRGLQQEQGEQDGGWQ